MAVINVNLEDVRTLARLMRAEAEGEGEQGMLMVGNVGVNRILVPIVWIFREFAS